MTRLKRLDSIFDEAPLYFITATTGDRAKIMANEATHQAFLHFCRGARERGVIVGRYVLMPDHLHLFVCIPPGPATLSGWIKSLKNALSKHWRAQGIEAPHWQKGFFDHLVRNHESEADKWAYMRNNPVRAGLAEKPEEWPYAGEIHPFVPQ